MTPSFLLEAPVLKIANNWVLIQDAGILMVQLPGKQLAFPVQDPRVHLVLQSLVQQGQTLAALENSVKKYGDAALLDLRQGLGFLKEQLLLGVELQFNKRVLGLVEPLSTDFEFDLLSLDTESTYIFSRFALLRLDEGHWVLESPLLLCRLKIADPEIIMLAQAFSSPKSVHTVVGNQAPLDSKAGRIVEILYALGFLERVPESGEANSPSTNALALWEFHDLYFHSRSRIGRHNNPVGLSPRFTGLIPPAPAFKDRSGYPVIFLPKANFNDLKEKEISLAEVMERRKSNRMHGEPAITLKEIGEFLFRTARVKEFKLKGDYMISSRPYPNAGASYEIEVYLLIHQCADLPKGFYHYDPVEHGLVQLPENEAAATALYHSTNYAEKEDFEPQVILYLASRFARNSWKYQTISYANTLKHVGVLFHSMSLVATAMGLAGNAWSTSNSDLFNQLSGTNYYDETSVGEFLLGAPSDT